MTATTHPPAGVSPEVATEDAALVRWQRRLLPFMVGSLMVVGLTFIGATLYFFHDLERRLEHRTVDIVKMVDTVAEKGTPSDPQAHRDWYVRSTLEGIALQQRFNAQAAVVKGRLWTRFMGFLTGMLLALTGCIFVLGKMREPVSASGQAPGGYGVAIASSPGVFLAFLGTSLIGISLIVQTNVEMADTAVYLPQQVEVSRTGTVRSSDRGEPVPIAPAPTSGAASAAPGRKEWPESVRRQIEELAKAKPSDK